MTESTVAAMKNDVFAGSATSVKENTKFCAPYPSATFALSTHFFLDREAVQRLTHT